MMMLLPSSQQSVKEIWFRELPLCFNEQHPKPLKANIYQDLLHYYRYETRFSQQDIKLALERYMNSINYLKCLTAGSQRFDLWGKIAGKVTRTQARQAQWLAQLKDNSIRIANEFSLAASAYCGSFAVV